MRRVSPANSGNETGQHHAARSHVCLMRSPPRLSADLGSKESGMTTHLKRLLRHTPIVLAMAFLLGSSRPAHAGCMIAFADCAVALGICDRGLRAGAGRLRAASADRSVDPSRRASMARPASRLLMPG